MSTLEDQPASKHGRLRVPRSRGAVSGVLLVLLGAWGALAPYVGPTFDYAFTPDNAFDGTPGRFWMQLVPGVVAALGGFLLLTTANRLIAVFGGYLAIAAGAWYVIGPVLGQDLLGSWSDLGEPVGGSTARALEQLGMLYGLGALIILIAAQAVGRVTVRSVRDLEAVVEHDRARQEFAPLPDERDDLSTSHDTAVFERPASPPSSETVVLDRNDTVDLGKRSTATETIDLRDDASASRKLEG